MVNATDLTYIANSSGVVEFVQRTNSGLVDGYLGLLIFLMVYIIILLAFVFQTGEFGKALATSSFIGFGISMTLVALGLLHPLTIFVMLILTAGGVAMLKGN